MKKILSLMSVVLFLVGCGEQVNVPNTYVAKKQTPSGLQEGLIYPSIFRLDYFCFNCDNAILAEVSDYPEKEKMQIFMPKDKLNLTVEVRGTFSVSKKDSVIEQIFASVPSQAQNERISFIPLKKVYDTYAQPIIRRVVRSVITKYSIMEVMENRDGISVELTKEVRKELKTTPITISNFGLADVQPPAVIVTAQEETKSREIAIARAEANKQVKLKEAEAALEVAIKQQQVDLKEAETQVMVNKKLGEGVTNAWVTQRSLKVLESLKDGNHFFVLPYEALTNPAMLIGMVNQATANVNGVNKQTSTEDK